MDREYIILDEISKNGSITQRELSKHADISLGSVNLLLNKMVKEGLVKIKEIPMNRVAYMLTPNGMAEKLSKTRSYIRIHYNLINETKNKIQAAIYDILRLECVVVILLEMDEISELVKMAVDKIDGVKLITSIEQLSPDDNVFVLSRENYQQASLVCSKVRNLLELI